MFSFSCIKNISIYRVLWCLFFFGMLTQLYVVMNLDNIRKDENVLLIPMRSSTYSHTINCSLVVCPAGNLGNQIWEYMSLFVIWKKYESSGFKPYLEKTMFDRLKELFPKLSIPPSIGNKCVGYRFIVNWENKVNVILRNETINTYDNWFNLDSNKDCTDIYLEPYSARFKDVYNYGIDKILKELYLNPQLVAICQSILVSLKQKFHMEMENVTFVGMHYRGTDYDDHLRHLYNITKPPTTYRYYLAAMDYFKRTYKANQIIFILITIDQNWLERNEDEIMMSSNSNVTVVVNPTNGDRLHDLVLLSQCNHTIINYGTFGSTAALLAGGTTFVQDLKLHPDTFGPTVAVGIASLIDEWHKLP